MFRTTKQLLGTTALSVAILSVAPTLVSAEDTAASAIEQGKEIAFDRKLGNCLACHSIKGGKSPGNIAPPLLMMKARFPDKAALRAQIWDPMVSNPLSMMPPFGRHKILSEEQIDKLTEYLYSL
jgi:sulfur-oxidizing protein SoxX